MHSFCDVSVFVWIFSVFVYTSVNNNVSKLLFEKSAV